MYDDFLVSSNYVTISAPKTPLSDCKLMLPVATESILIIKTKVNYPTRTNRAETISLRTDVG